MDRLAPSMRGFARSLWLVAALVVAACGDPSCPADSFSVNGRCEPRVELECDDDEVEDGGVCVAAPESPDADVPDAQADAGDGDGDGDGDAGDAGNDAAVDQDSSVTESMDPRCDTLRCGDHGACQVVDDEARCECVDGYGGELCAICEIGLVLDGQICVLACDASHAPDCGELGECDDSEGPATCVCEHPAAGQLCDECAEGFALQDDGSCEPDCGVCGPHKVCNETLTTPACECAAGYVANGSTCNWVGDGTTGGIVNSSFNDSTAWTLQDASIAGGQVNFDNPGSGASCRLGSVEQTFTMPVLEDAEALAIEVDINSSCIESNAENCPSLLLEMGGSLTRLKVATQQSSQTLIACLGASGYGGDVTMRILPSLLGAINSGQPVLQSCADDVWPTVQAVRIVSASLCPRPNWILDGTFASAASWSLSNASIAGGTLTFSSQGDASTDIVVPSTAQLASPAVRVGFSNGVNLQVLIDGALPLGIANAPAGTAGTRTVCLPDWAHGAGHRLTLHSNSASSLLDVAIVEDSACDAGGFDAGFERGASGQPSLQSWISSSGTPLVDTAAARPGSTKGLRMSAATNAFYGLTYVPKATATAGPAFQIYHRTTGASLGVSALLLPVSSTTFDLGGATWAKHLTCLQPAWAGQLVPFFIGAGITNGPGQLHVDDVGAVLDATCE